MKKKILWLMLSFLLVAALVLASCAPAVPGEQEEEEEEEEEEEPVGEQEEEEEEEEEEEVAWSPYGGTLTVAARRHGERVDCISWDVNGGPWSQTSFFVGPVQEGVQIVDLSRGATGTKEHVFQGRYLPWEFLDSDLSLIESWEKLADPLRLVYHVRPGIYWQDKPGVMEARELTADDIAFTVQRHWDSEVSPREWCRFLKSIDVPDKYTVVFELNFPFPDFGYWFVWGEFTKIIPHEMVEAGAEDWRNLCGTGPFTLTNYVSGSHMEYTRYPNYRGRITIGGKEYQIPFVDKLVYPLMPDDAVRLASLRTGKVDIWEDVAWVYRDTLAASNPELRSWAVAAYGSYRVSMREDIGPPFDILEVRRAMSMAIDIQAVIDRLFGGYGTLVNYPIPAYFPESTYTPLEKLPSKTRELYDYNPEKAKALLADAGYPDGFNTKIMIASTPIHVDMMALVKDYWADIGIDLELEARDVTSHRHSRLNRTYEQMVGAYDSTPTPAADILNSYMPDTLVNTSIVDDPHLNEIMARWDQALDADESNRLIKEANAYILSQAFDIYLPMAETFLYAWPWVKNYEGELMTQYVSSANAHAIVWIDQAMKAEMGY